MEKASPTRIYPVDTSNILFICGGVFSGIDEVIKHRTDKSGIGFEADKDIGLSCLDCGNFRARGFSKIWFDTEFVGRFQLSPLHELDEEALVRILQEPKNALLII